ncbi:MAG: hypothetical protein ACOZAN_04670 [Patescibacteria group bacterium]
MLFSDEFVCYLDMMMYDFSSRTWFKSLEPGLQALIKSAEELINFHLGQEQQFSDFSFLVFPMAKAYEGFLKMYLLELGLITPETYRSRRFRIGRAINPDVRYDQRDEYWLFDDLVHKCGEVKARLFWDTWLECRNQVFHYFPNGFTTMSYQQATMKIRMIDQAISNAMACLQVGRTGSSKTG